MKSIITFGSLETPDSIFELAEERTRELRSRSIKIIQSEEQDEKRMKKSRQNVRDLRDTVKYTITRVIRSQRREEKGAERIFEEIMVENVQNLMKNINLHIQEDK